MCIYTVYAVVFLNEYKLILKYKLILLDNIYIKCVHILYML